MKPRISAPERTEISEIEQKVSDTMKNNNKKRYRDSKDNERKKIKSKQSGTEDSGGKMEPKARREQG